MVQVLAVLMNEEPAGHYQKVIFIAFSSKGKKEKKGESPSSQKEIGAALAL